MSHRMYTIDPVSEAREPPFLAGQAGDGAGVVLGLYGWEVVGLWFAADGRLAEFRVRPFRPHDDADPETDYDVYTETCRIRREWAAELSLEPAPVAARGFALGQYKIEIQDLPDHLERFRDDPTVVPPGEREKWAGYLARWQASGAFVLRWSKEYHLSADGRVQST